MRTRFADAAQHADAFFVIRAISSVSNHYAREIFTHKKSSSHVAKKSPTLMRLEVNYGDHGLKPHLHGWLFCKRIFCNAIQRFFMRDNLSRRVVTHTRRDLLAAIAFVKNRCRVSNICDLRCWLYFARLDARILLARDHLLEVDFNVSRVPGQSRACVNSKSYAIYESHQHSAMHKCFASRWLRLSQIYFIKYCVYGTQ